MFTFALVVYHQLTLSLGPALEILVQDFIATTSLVVFYHLEHPAV